MSYVLYNPNTGSIEGAWDSYLVKVPDHECDSPESVENWLDDYYQNGFPISQLIALKESM